MRGQTSALYREESRYGHNHLQYFVNKRPAHMLSSLAAKDGLVIIAPIYSLFDAVYVLAIV